MFLDHTQRRTTVGVTPLDEWSARRRDLSTWQHTTLTTDKYPCRPLTCWDRGFESHRGHGYLSVVSVVCCQVERSLRRADHSSRGVLPTVLRRCVWSRNIKNRCSVYIYNISSLRVNASRWLYNKNNQMTWYSCFYVTFLWNYLFPYAIYMMRNSLK